MGIKHLNKYLIEKCKSIKKIHLSEFKNIKIVIDTSIYMYKFMSENALLENMQKMIKMFHKYNITPIFIFDGKPPPEKRELLDKRYLLKCQAKEKYNDLLLKKEASEMELNLLKNQFIKITESDILKVKELFVELGVYYFDSTSESDPVCVYFVNSNKAHACLTEDMDMFVYGCNRIFRNLDLENHQIQYYDTQLILKELNITHKHFKQILVLSGTDYNIKSTTNLYNTLSLFQKYKYNYNYLGLTEQQCFYEWLQHYKPYYIEDRNKLNHCFEMFNLSYYNTELQPFIHLTI
jgi:hypothetical protein